MTKGIILSGGSGTRLYPITRCISKQLLPIYDKPMIYYPLSTLMLANIRDILIITTPHDLHQYQTLLGDGSQFGISIQYVTQPKPEGLAQAFILGENFISNENVCLILGDNIFHGPGFQEMLIQAQNQLKQDADCGAVVFGCYVKDPERYGVIDFKDPLAKIPQHIIEKPAIPPSHYAITGLYFYDNSVIHIAKSLKPSARGEFEITDVNNVYLANDRLKVNLFHRGFTWLDTGTHQSLIEAAKYVEVIEQRHGLRVCCPEEIAWRKGFISSEDLVLAGKSIGNNSYGAYLLSLLAEKIQLPEFAEEA